DRLRREDPERAARVRRRAEMSVERIRAAFPDEPVARVLGEENAFDDEPCPALDPGTGTCDLYAWRPITCRTFGPAVRMGAGSIAVCELCYQGATDEQIAACEVDLDFAEVEAQL